MYRYFQPDSRPFTADIQITVKDGKIGRKIILDGLDATESTFLCLDDLPHYVEDWLHDNFERNEFEILVKRDRGMTLRLVHFTTVVSQIAYRERLRPVLSTVVASM